MVFKNDPDHVMDEGAFVGAEAAAEAGEAEVGGGAFVGREEAGADAGELADLPQILKGWREEGVGGVGGGGRSVGGPELSVGRGGRDRGDGVGDFAQEGGGGLVGNECGVLLGGTQPGIERGGLVRRKAMKLDEKRTVGIGVREKGDGGRQVGVGRSGRRGDRRQVEGDEG